VGGESFKGLGNKPKIFLDEFQTDSHKSQGQGEHIVKTRFSMRTDKGPSQFSTIG